MNIKLGQKTQMYHKVDVPNSRSNLKWTPIFEWWMVGCEYENERQKYMFLNEIILHIENC